MTRIRQATENDLAWLLLQQREFDQFYGTCRSLFPSDPKVALEIMTNIVANQVMLIAEKDPEGTRLGFIAGALGPHPYNPEITVLSEQFWWVDPAHRGGTAGARLLSEFLDFGRNNAKWIVMTLEAKSPIDPAHLERVGFRLFERSYLLEIA